MLGDIPGVEYVRGLAGRAVDLAVSRGVDQAEAFASIDAAMGCGIEKDSIKGLSNSVSMGVGVRVLKQGRMGFSYATSEDMLSSAVERAIEFSKLSNTTEMEFPGPFTPPGVDEIYDSRVMETSPEDIVEFAKTILGQIASHQVVSALEGGVGCGVERFAVATSNGMDVFSEGTDFGGGVYAMLKDTIPATGFHFGEGRMMSVDLEGVAETAARMALESRGPKTLDTGVTNVIFSPHAFSSLLEFILAPACQGDRMARGESFFSDKKGLEVASSKVCLLDDALLPNGLNSSPIDDEGTASHRTPIIEEGVLLNPLYDRVSALENRGETTGNGVRGMQWTTSRTYKSPPGTRVRNMVLECRDAFSMEELLRTVGDGILVHDVLGAHTSNPASGDFSVNSSVVFGIRGGELADAGKQIMLSGNMREVLKNVIGTGGENINVSGGLSPTAFSIPYIAVGGIRVS